MKKVLSLKTIVMLILSLIIIGTSCTVLATDVLGGNNTTTNITPEDYNLAGDIPVDPNYAAPNNNTTGNKVSNGLNTSSAYNSTNNTTDLPQTGIEDYNIGILLIICVAASIYTYKKMKDYKNI